MERRTLYIFEEDIGLRSMMLPRLLKLGYRQDDIQYLGRKTEIDTLLMTQENRPNILLIDFDPFDPQDTGKTFIQKVRSPQSAWADIPIVVVTSEDGEIAAKKLHDYHIDSIIEFPFEEGVFETCLMEILDDPHDRRIE